MIATVARWGHNIMWLLMMVVATELFVLAIK